MSPGMISAWLGALGVLAVLCFRFPQWLTTPEVRAVVDIPLLRSVLLVGLLAGAALGGLALLANRGRRPGLLGLALVFLAFALGGADVPVPDSLPRRNLYLGLDYFVLSLFFTALAFIGIERLKPRLPAQGPLRPDAGLDLAYFALNHLGIAFILLTVNAVADGAARLSPGLPFGGWPVAVQFALIVLVADLTQYVQHRAFHGIPFLWRFHAIHHSIERMDWLAGSRLHFLEVLFQRALVIAPVHLLGFGREAIDLYVVFAGTITVFIHANLGLGFGWLRYVIATPAFHHWHHAAEEEARDRNFAVHLPLLDLLFGTFHLPRRWPERYGLLDEKLPDGLLAQHLYPFRRDRR